MSEDQIKVIAELVKSSMFAGIIATNTSHMPNFGEGGVSGRLIRDKSQNVRNYVLSILSEQREKDVIGVGGVESINEDMWDFWQNGGKYMQIYTAFIYQGPKLFTSIASMFDYLFKYFGVENVEELIRLAHCEK